MSVGIEKISFYTGRCYLNIADLTHARGEDTAYIKTRLMCEARSVIPVWEDTVTLAVNAALRLLSHEDRETIELLIVGTESAVDFGKPISTWVHRFCNLSPNCRSFEIKHACYSGTGALKMAAHWVASMPPGKKALVINSDYSRPHNAKNLEAQESGHSHEFILGGCAVAMLVSADPQVLSLDLAKAGYWTQEIPDSFRPTAQDEMGNQQVSLYAYLDALEGAYEHFEARVGTINYDQYFKKHIYHAPFPGMTLQAHRTLLNRFGVTNKTEIQDSFHQKVAESLYFARRIGTSYGASNFVSLLGLVQSAPDVEPGDAISFYSYGSGCQSEFYSATLGSGAKAWVQGLNLDEQLKTRFHLEVADYEANEQERTATMAQRTYIPNRTGLNGAYAHAYQGQGLLVLLNVENFYREYIWS
jgi:hydroxymethylglutaryl-CoA synthase